MSPAAQDPRLEIMWLPSQDADSTAVTRLVAEFVGASRHDVRIARACRSCGSDRHGKPHVVVPAGSAACHVSLSRSNALAVVAVTDAGPVGVDVEALQQGIDIVTWARIESIVKATGHGLMIDPAEIGVTAPDTPPELVRWPDAEPIDTGIWMSDLEAPTGHVGAVTVLSDLRPPITLRAAPGG